MKSTANPTDIIQYIPLPAFIVKSGAVIDVNDAARSLQISSGTPIVELITHGLEEYDALKTGKLYLQLKIGRAWVSVHDDIHLFCLEDNYSSPELKAFALAAQHLRMPLSNAVSSMELLTQNKTVLECAELKQQLGQINRSLYQMIRAVCNMSDVSQLGSIHGAHHQIQNVTAVFAEFFEKASEITKDSHRTLEFNNFKKNVNCAIDAQLLERMFLNLVSNAIKFSPSDSNIKVTLKHKENRLMLSVENSISNLGNAYSDAFSRFLREPGLDSSQTGIGLGMSIISQSVIAHQGTVLLNMAQKKRMKVTVSFPVNTTCQTEVRSPMLYPDSYTGGIDNFLVELSDILPSHYYEDV